MEMKYALLRSAIKMNHFSDKKIQFLKQGIVTFEIN